MNFKGKVEGFSEFDRLLKKLPQRVENNILQRATVNTLKKVMLAPMKAAAPRHTAERSAASKKYGTLFANIRVNPLRNKRKGERGASISTGRAFWGWILEKGSRYIAANPWFFPTFVNRKSTMIATLGEEIGAGIESEAEKEYRGGRK